MVEAAEKSRGSLVDAMIENIGMRPLWGSGFGLASDLSTMNVEREPVTGLAIGAPVEKGVLFVAVVEEVGLIGAFFVFLWMWLLIHRSAKAGIIAFCVMATALAINIGEAILFSPGGPGLLILIVLTWAVTNESMVRRRVQRIVQ